MEFFFWLSVVFAAAMIFSFFTLSVTKFVEGLKIQKERQRRERIAVFCLAAFVLFLFSFGFYMGRPNGRALEELDVDTTYTTEWVRIGDSVMSMKLMTDKGFSYYYEIPKDKLIYFCGDEKNFPEKFRVLTSETDKVYALVDPDRKR